MHCLVPSLIGWWIGWWYYWLKPAERGRSGPKMRTLVERFICWLIDCLAGACRRWEGWILLENQKWWFSDWLLAWQEPAGGVGPRREPWLMVHWLIACSVADPGCLSWISDPSFFHPRSRIRIFFPIPGPRSRICIEELSILIQKNGLQTLRYMIWFWLMVYWLIAWQEPAGGGRDGPWKRTMIDDLLIDCLAGSCWRWRGGPFKRTLIDSSLIDRLAGSCWR